MVKLTFFKLCAKRSKLIAHGTGWMIHYFLYISRHRLLIYKLEKTVILPPFNLHGKQHEMTEFTVDFNYADSGSNATECHDYEKGETSTPMRS